MPSSFSTSITKPIVKNQKRNGLFLEIVCVPSINYEGTIIADVKGETMIGRRMIICSIFMLGGCLSSFVFAQEKKLERLRVGGGSASATQMSLWLAKEGNYYEKHGLNVEVISIPGSSLAIQAMLSGELPIIQAG